MIFSFWSEIFAIEVAPGVINSLTIRHAYFFYSVVTMSVSETVTVLGSLVLFIFLHV